MTLIWLTFRERVQRSATSSFQAAFSTSNRGLVDLDPGVGDPFLFPAQADQRLAEGGSRGAALDGELASDLSLADQPQAVVDATRTERPWGDLERTTSPRRMLSFGTRTSAKDTSPWPTGSSYAFIVESIASNLDPRGVQRDQHHRVPVVPISIGVESPMRP